MVYNRQALNPQVVFFYLPVFILFYHLELCQHYMKQSVAKINKYEIIAKVNVKEKIYIYMCACIYTRCIYTHKKIPNALSFLNLYLVSCPDYVLIYEQNYWSNLKYYATKNHVK